MSCRYKDVNVTDDDETIKTENIDIEMPEDLSAKYRSVSVQTEKCQDKFGQLLEGFSQKQVRSFMNVLVQIVLKRDGESVFSPELVCTDNSTKVPSS